MPTPDVTLRIDTTGTAFGVAPTYTDHTADLMANSLSTSWGRSDAQSEPSPRTCSFELKNDDGSWTPGNAAAPAGWDPGAPVNVQVTVNATDYDRFTGFVDEIEPGWPGGVQSWSVVRVSCSDLTSRLSVNAPLRSMVEQEMLEDDPLYLYPLSEAAGSVSAGDISPNGNGPAVKVNSATGSQRSLTFGEDLLLPDPTTGARLGTNGASGKVALALPVMPPTAGAFSIGYVFTTPATPPTYNGFLAHLSGGGTTSNSYSYIHLYLESVTGVLRMEIYDPLAPNGPGWTLWDTTDICDGLAHTTYLTVSADRLTVSFYVDGELVVDFTQTDPMILADMTANQVGGVVSLRSESGQFPGVIGKAAMWEAELTAAQVLLHHNAAMGTLVESSDDRFARIAGYGNVTTAGLPTGQATMGHQNTAGQGLLEALAKVARTEGSVAYATAAGALTFGARDQRYNATAGVTVDGSDLSTDLTVRRDRQGLANEITVTNEGGAEQRVVDTASQTAIGRFDGGSFEVASSTDADAYQNAAFQVGTRKSYATRIPNVKVNMLKAADALREDVLAADTGTLLHATGLPPQAPATTADLFIEGGTEQIGLSAWDVDFFTSPNLPPFFTIGDATNGAIEGPGVIAW